MSSFMVDNKALPGVSRPNGKVKPIGQEDSNQTSRPAASTQDNIARSGQPPALLATNTSSASNNNADIKSQQANSSVATANQALPVNHKQGPPSNVPSTNNSATTNHRLETTKCPDRPPPPPPLARKTSMTAGKFKEKRPEPLKLNQNPNQEIPLDLSVKSAGNAPSGGMFLLTNSNHLTTLETPRIQWEDNDTLLTSSKARLFSTSTTASQRARLPSLIGDSPPITPGTSSVLDPTIPSSPLSATTLRSLYTTPHSISFAADSPLNTLIASPFELNKFQLLRYYQVRNDARGKPRRSCSSDNLDHMSSKNSESVADSGTTLNPNDNDLKKWINKLKTNRHEEGITNRTTNDINNHSLQQNKKSSISPLATKSLSSSNNPTTATTNFPYLNNHQQLSPNNCCDHQMKSPNSLTPTSVANATANLFNITLNSPTRNNSDLSPTLTTATSLFDTAIINQQQQQQSYHPSSISSLSGFLATTGCHNKSQPVVDTNLIDPLFSAAAAAHQSINLLSSTSSNSTTSSVFAQNNKELNNEQQRYNNLLHSSYLQQQTHNNNQQTNHPNHHHHHQHHLSSLGGSTTLNTPTMISPSQLKTGNICFLPSPTLSPMPSVFELPSPLLMFTHNNNINQQQSNSGINANGNTSNTSIGNHETSNNSNITGITNKPPNSSSSSTCSSSPSSMDTKFTTAISVITTAANNDEVKPDRSSNMQVVGSSCPTHTVRCSTATATATTPLVKPTSGPSAAAAANKSPTTTAKIAITSPGPNVRALSDNTLNRQSICTNDSAVGLSVSDLSHLITPAITKVKSMKMDLGDDDNDDDDDDDDGDDDCDCDNVGCVDDDGDGDVHMDIVNDENDDNIISGEPDVNNNEIRSNVNQQQQQSRPATVIPQIYVTESSKMSHLQQSEAQMSSCNQTNWPANNNNNRGLQQSRSLCPLLVNNDNDNHQITNGNNQQRCQRDLLGKSSLSPKSFQTKVNHYRSERLESCSAPPDVYQRRARAKIKTATRDSSADLTSAAQHHSSAQNFPSINQQHNVPYARFAPTTQQHLHQSTPSTNNTSVESTTNHGSARPPSLTGRSSSAEPQGSINHHLRSSLFYPNGSVNSATHYMNAVGSASGGPLSQNYGFSHSAQHLQGNPRVADVMRPNGGGVEVGQLLFANRQLQQQPSHGQTPSLVGSQSQQLPSPAQHQHPDHPIQQPNHHHHHQQQHSISTGELHRISDIRSQLQAQSLFLVPAGADQRHHHNQHQPNKQHQFEHYQSQHHNHQNFNQPMTQQQNLRSSLNGLDNLLNHNHRQQQHQIHQQEQHNHHHPHQHQIAASVPMRRFEHEARQHSSDATTTTTTTVSNMRPPPIGNDQPFVVNLFTGLCGRGGAIDGAGNAQPTPSIVERSSRPSSGQASLAATHTKPSTTSSAPPNKLFGSNTNNNNCLYAGIDIESHSESISNSSLDFCSLTGSRSSSANSSNVAAKKYHCEQCSKSFTRSDMLTRHKRLHSGDRPFQCNECKQEFSRSDHLSTHMRTHTGEKPYKCKLCSYSACRKDMITRHMKVHNRSPNSLHPMESN